MADLGEVIFVGGTAFSGTELIAGLLGAHPGVAAVPVAVRFHSDDRGVPGLLGGRIGLDDFLGELRGPWWNGSGPRGAPGLSEIVTSADFEAAVERFRRSYHRDPLDSCRALYRSLLAPVAVGGRALVEASHGNMKHVRTLALLFPEARFVHVARDGRDAAAAAVAAGEIGSRRLWAGVERWVRELEDIEAAIRGEEDGALYAIPAGELGVVVLDELVAGARDAAYRALLEALALDDAAEMRSFGERRLEPTAAGLGRWRQLARGPAAWRVERRYRRALTELDRERNHVARPLMSAYERLG